MKRRVAMVSAALLCGGLIETAWAQDRPGIDRPIRVGMFKGTGTGSRYWHTSIHTSHTVVAGILANPAGSSLGPDLIVPPQGFTFYSMPVATDSAGNECAGNGCGPTTTQIAQFVAALDTLDVMILSNVTDFGSRVSNAAQRQAIADFWTYKGYVGVHGITDSPGTWAALDSIHGARFRGHPLEQAGTLRPDFVHDEEAAWQYLNRGLFSNGFDTTLFEEWFYFTISGAAIRARGRPTTNLDEASIANPGTQAPMEDHPMSWYRQLPTGGRFFYTALGHRADIWENARFFRRQLYNAILWTAKYDSLAATALRPNESGGRLADAARVSFTGSILAVSVLHDGPHTVEVRSLNGRRVMARRSTGRTEHAFGNIRPGIHLVSVTTPEGREVRKAVIP